MTSENKPGRDLALWQEHVPTRIDRSKSDALLERARGRVAVAKPPSVLTAPPAPVEPAGERVLVAMTCSATGKGFAVFAERRDDEWSGQELMLHAGDALPAADGMTAEAGLLSGEYRVNTAPGWRCPLCNSSGFGDGCTTWSCNCGSRYRGALHCAGSTGSLRYCACGKLEERHFGEAGIVPARGRSLGVASRQPVSGLPAVRSTGLRNRDR